MERSCTHTCSSELPPCRRRAIELSLSRIMSSFRGTTPSDFREASVMSETFPLRRTASDRWQIMGCEVHCICHSLSWMRLVLKLSALRYCGVSLVIRDIWDNAPPVNMRRRAATAAGADTRHITAAAAAPLPGCFTVAVSFGCIRSFMGSE